MRGACVLVLGVVAGCSGDNTATDAARAVTVQAVISDLTILEADDPRAFDLDHDDTPDNQLGVLAADWSGFFNLLVLTGRMIVLAELTDVDSAVDDSSIELRIYAGQDEDLPANPADDRTGSEHFYIAPGSLDASGVPLLRVPSGVAGGLFVAELDQPLGAANFQLHDVHIRGSLLRDLSGISDGTLAAVIAISNLAKIGMGSGTALNLLVAHYLAQPDLDLDGDGLERLADTDGDGFVDRCTDGGGVVIDGTACVDDPRIADGFSAAFGLSAVRCVIDPPCNPAAGPCPATGTAIP